MYKLLSIIFLCAINTITGAHIRLSDINIEQNAPISRQSVPNLGQWESHIVDFIELIDLEKVMGIVMEYMNDEEIIKFAQYTMSPEFGKLIAEFERMAEFKEATNYLLSKGYDTIPVIDFVNSLLKIPPYENKKTIKQGSSRGISDMLQSIIDNLPLDKMKELFESKLENDQEVSELFKTLTSEEFLDIMNRMAQNVTFKNTKQTLELHGVNFKQLCSMAKEIFSDYYMGVFCNEF